MVVTLVLPWFPILLGVGVGGRLLGRTRGLFLGIVSALFWVALVQASAGLAIWHDPWIVASIVAGAVAIATMGCWSGDCQPPVEDCQRDVVGGQCPPYGRDPSERQLEAAAIRRIDNLRSEESQATLQKISAAIEQFDDWLEQHRDDGDPWPKFDEFVRLVMYQCCRATHVRPYRLLSEGEELVPLREPDPIAGSADGDHVERIPARRGIIGHVVTAGRAYLAGDAVQGELVAKLAEDLQEPALRTATIVWCFPVKRGTRCLGVVTAAHLAIAPENSKTLLCTVEHLINQFWRTLWETVRSRSAVQDDPVSGLPTRPGFLRTAEQSLQESYEQGEPVAVVVIALEGLRSLSDSGRWEVADELVHEVSNALRRKVRMDDRLGRFDGSRFILLLRRVDTELASLIAAQLLERVSAICGDGPADRNYPADGDKSRWGATIGVRCGLAGSGTEKPDLRTLVAQALAQCHRARQEGTGIANDIGSGAVVSGAPR